MWYEVVTEFEYKDQRGKVKEAVKNSLVDILNVHEVRRLKAEGKITDRKLGKNLKTSLIPSDPKLPEGRGTLVSSLGPKIQRTTGQYRVIKDFKWRDQRGAPFLAEIGQLIDVLNKHDVEHLFAMGYIINKRETSDIAGLYGEPVSKYTMVKRIGIWVMTSNNYSGGRIHMYQYAWCLASLGADVWMITNSIPSWIRDYPLTNKIHIAIAGKDTIPPDLDLIVTDSKHDLGRRALGWKQKHPTIPFVGFNFETPNWVAKYVKDYADKLHAPKEVFQRADHFIANSQLSKEHLAEWIEKDIPCGVLNPAVNTFGLEASKLSNNIRFPKRPYAVFSARHAKYKGGNMVLDAIWNMDIPFDVAIFGRTDRPPKETNLHQAYIYDGKCDAEKFALMRNAHVVLAPSLFEGYGMVPGEALASGTPCMVYDLPVLREAYKDALIYVPWNDPKAFKETLEKVAREKKIELDGTSKKIIETKGMDSMTKELEKLPYHAIKKKYVSSHMICYWGFIPESLESIYPYVDEIKIAYGPTALNKNVIPDGSLERILAFPDPDNKIIIEAREVWRDKQEMREWGTKNIKGNFHLLLDADEVWVGLEEWLRSNIGFSSPRWLNFWHDNKHWVYDSPKLAGLRWGKRIEPFGSVCPHYRWSYWRSSYKWIRHSVLADIERNALHTPSHLPAEEVPEAVIYHFGHVLNPAIMKAKHEFYRNRDGDNTGRRDRQKAWHEWNGQLGDCGDGIIKSVDWELPDIVQKGFKSLMEIGK